MTQPVPFTHNELQLSIEEEVLRFSREQIAPHELADEFQPAAWQAMAEFGLMGLPFPRDYGGCGADVQTCVLAMEAFARGGGSLSLALSWGASTILCGIPILNFGTPQQKQRFLPGLAAGTSIGAFALTEPGVGSDAAAIATRAVRRGDRYLLNGSKMFITNGPIADVFLVLASTEPDLGRNGITAFLVEKGTPGFTAGKPLDKMGHRASPTSELVFDNCWLPLEAVLGVENRGYVEVAFSTLEWERGCLLGPAAGALSLLRDRVCGYARTRQQFGQPIANFGAVRQLLGDVSARALAAGLHWRRTAWLKDAGRGAVLESSVAKLVMSEDCLRAADEGVQVHGGYGYIREFPVEQLYRDAKLYTLGGGTSEIQQRILIEMLLKEYREGRAPGRLRLDDPMLAALAGDGTVERLIAFRQFCQSQLAGAMHDHGSLGRSQMRHWMLALSRAEFWTIGGRSPAGPSLVRALYLDELATVDPWLAGAAVSVVGEPKPRVPIAALAVRESPVPAVKDALYGVIAMPAGSGTYRLRGRKARVLNGPWADQFIVPAWAPSLSTTLVFSVDAGAQGVKVSNSGPWPTAEGLPFGDVEFADAPATLLGSGTDSAELLDLFLVQHRVRLAAVACGVAGACLAEGVALASTLRELAPRLERQEVLFPLAKLRGELDTARLLVWRAAQLLDQSPASARAVAAAAKARAAEAARAAAAIVLEMAGAHGMAGSGRSLARFHSVASALGIEGGTTAELREVLAAEALASSPQPELEIREQR